MACGFAACKPKIDQEKPTAGSADFSRYLAIGNSATAGYADGTLYRTGQINSYPNILAEYFKLVGGGEFRQPLLPAGDKGYPDPRMLLRVVQGTCDTTLTTVLEERGKDSAISTINVASDIPFNNMGLPNARAIDYIATGYGNVNVYARRSFKDINASPLKEALRVNPTFFTLWIGNNDVMLNAIFGGNSSPVPITGENEFRTAMDSIMTALLRKNAKGVVLNLPDISSLPYFSTIKPNELALNETQATSLNVYWRDVKNLPVRFHQGTDNYFVIQDGNEIRQIRNGEMLLLSIPRDSLKCAQWGTVKPIPGNYVLTASEIAAIKNATANFNNIISSLASAKKIPLVDVNGFLKTIEWGIHYNGVAFNATYVNGGFYSLDGIHLNPRGNAMLADHIIKKINTSYGATIPSVDVNNYSGLKFP